MSHFTPEAQLLILLARTSVSSALQIEIQDRVRESVNWSLVWKLAREHGVAPLVYRTLMVYCPSALPKETRESFRRHIQANAIFSMLVAEELVTLMDALAAKGIRVIPFKGPTLGVMAYGDLTLRECMDLDLIVEQSSIPEARHVLWSHGYQLASHDTDGCDAQDEPFHSFVKKNGMFRVDLQWTMARPLFSFRLDREHFWKHLRPVRLPRKAIMALAPEELLIVLCVHGSKHAWEDLKWVCDVAELILRRRNLDWSRVLHLSREWGYERMVLMGFAMARSIFDVALPRQVCQMVDSDADISDLVKRMPRRLLKVTAQGIDERDAEALYFTLKDSWIERWKYGVALCRADVSAVTTRMSWFHSQKRLRLLHRIVQPLHGFAARWTPTAWLRRHLVKWFENPR
jgi:hypothetical protein